jgi:DNA polymerase-3 subunit delta'
MPLMLNPGTAAAIGHIKAELPHALMLYGTEGVGLRTLALDIAGRSIARIVEPTNTDGEVDTDKGSVRVEKIRELYDATKMKQTSRAVYVIDNADTMSPAAQNAFLKLLEEPNRHVHFILTAHDSSKFLPTVLSRTQSISVHKISESDSLELMTQLGVSDSKKRQQLLFMALGRPALLTRLATDEKLFLSSVQTITDARIILQGTAKDKMVVLSKYWSDRHKTIQLLESALAIITLTMNSNPSDDIIAMGERLAIAYDRISMNGNVKLHLLSSMV